MYQNFIKTIQTLNTNFENFKNIIGKTWKVENIIKHPALVCNITFKAVLLQDSNS
jgi:hypothetical protein